MGSVKWIVENIHAGKDNFASYRILSGINLRSFVVGKVVAGEYEAV